MADDVDFAEERIEKELASALAARVVYAGESAHECECGEVISEGRRLAVPGAQECITCAERSALKMRGVRRG
ncbi:MULTISPECIES: TraR/DksA C4-type zinc finger protein [unclassified Pseudomonas]|uniref:TraR/DksA C4-type zinc finger protein n=1 Tax=unclassified Pseudomonas TaxID=196821 RepID=UPI001472C650|nr:MULTISPECIES: TraR/DksA C4-type zinc finger protein [unclassified Pseudomonas]NMY36177.1 DnaK suppressor protein [Pseudomonas sp. WS 5078]NMY58918.1 DnaK suppressor protein [Pseudomonas sp. WS 5354]